MKLLKKRDEVEQPSYSPELRAPNTNYNHSL